MDRAFPVLCSQALLHLHQGARGGAGRPTSGSFTVQCLQGFELAQMACGGGGARGRLLHVRSAAAQARQNARRELPTPERGERLCRAFEMYRAVLPESGFDFEEVVFLVMSVAQGSEIHVNRCEGCSAVILSGRYTGGHWHCTHCDGSSEEGVDQPELTVESILRAGAGTKAARIMRPAVRSVRRTRKETH